MHTHTEHCKFIIILKTKKHKLGFTVQRSYSTRVVCCIVKSLYQHSCSQDGKVLAKLCQDKGNSRTKHRPLATIPHLESGLFLLKLHL